MKVKKAVLIFTQWSYRDPLVQTYTLPYVEIIRKILPFAVKIIIVTAEQPRVALSEKEIAELNREWKDRNMLLYATSYKRYGIRKMFSLAGQFFSLAKLIVKEKVDVIHAFCTPAGAVSYMLSKLTGRYLVLDSFEPHAEAMVENGTWKKKSLAYRILFWLEKKQAGRASFIIAAAAGMKDYAKEKYGLDISSKMFVKGACVDTLKFYPREKNQRLLKELSLEGAVVCVYAGKLGGIYLDKEVFRFIRSCYNYWGDRFRMLMLTNTEREELDRWLQEAGIPRTVLTNRFVVHSEIADYLSLGDFGITPVKPVPTKRYCTPIKDGEYWAMGLPVVISPGISDDSAIIQQNEIGVVFNFEQNEKQDKVVKAIDNLLRNNSREKLQTKIFSVAKQYRSFDIAEKIYPAIYGENKISS